MRLPIGSVVESLINFLLDGFGPVFDFIALIIGGFMANVEGVVLSLPPLVVILILTGVAWFLSTRRIAAFTFAGLMLVFSMGLWISLMQTFVLVLIATIVALLVGIPLGILMSSNKLLDSLFTPVLDFMQTMPPFVYLIPAVMFFGIGNVPGIMATVIFAMPPAIRLTRLGLKQVPDELEEVGVAFGSTWWQMLVKIKFPLALPSIMAGINQCIMLSLSMVVIASMIGASGLGEEVLNGIQRMEIGIGFEAGLSVVILAIILDRITGDIGKTNK